MKTDVKPSRAALEEEIAALRKEKESLLKKNAELQALYPDVDDMNIHQFTDWAAGEILQGLTKGEPINRTTGYIIRLVCQNKVFGGSKPKK